MNHRKNNAVFYIIVNSLLSKCRFNVENFMVCIFIHLHREVSKMLNTFFNCCWITWHKHLQLPIAQLKLEHLAQPIELWFLFYFIFFFILAEKLWKFQFNLNTTTLLLFIDEMWRICTQCSKQWCENKQNVFTSNWNGGKTYHDQAILQQLALLLLIPHTDTHTSPYTIKNYYWILIICCSCAKWCKYSLRV